MRNSDFRGINVTTTANIPTETTNAARTTSGIWILHPETDLCDIVTSFKASDLSAQKFILTFNELLLMCNKKPSQC